MSPITFGIIAIVSYLLGAGLVVAAMAKVQKNITGLLFVTVAVSLICVLVLIGVQIGGAK